MAIKGKVKSDSVSKNRLRLLTDIKVKLAEARDNLADESHKRVGLEKMQKIQLYIKRGRTVGRHGGSSKRPVHIVLLICELLVNDMPLSDVAANIQTISATMTGSEAKEFPCINFVRQCRVVVQNLNSNLAALRLGDADEWYQLFTDGTSIHQISFQNLVIAVIVDSNLDPVIVSSCMFLED